MKMRRLLSVGVLAALMAAGSCSDDYDERFDKLEQQLQDVISQVEGASELSTAIEALETEINTLKDVVGALPDGDQLADGLTSLEEQLSALNTELDLLAEIGATSDELAILAENSATSDELAALSDELASLSEDLISLVEQSASSDELAVLADELAQLAEDGATSEELAFFVEGLTSELNLVKSDLAELLQNSNVLTGNLVIFDENSLQAAEELGERIRIVTGEVKVNATNFEDGELDAVLGKIVAVTGNMAVLTDKNIDFSALESVGGKLEVEGEGVDLSGLRSVGGDFAIIHEGDYSFPGLEIVGNQVYLGIISDEESESPSRIINFLNVSAESVRTFSSNLSLSKGITEMNFGEIIGEADLVFPSATSIVFGDVAVTSLVAPIAETVELHFDGKLNGLMVITPATNTTVKVSEIGSDRLFLISYPFSDAVPYTTFKTAYDDNADANAFISAFPRPENWVSTINLPNLSKVGGDVGLVSQSLTMPSLVEIAEEQDVLFTQEDVSLPSLQIEGDLYATGAVNVDLGSISTTYLLKDDPSILETLKLNAQLNDATDETIGQYDFPALTSLTIIGATELEGDDAIKVELTSSFDVPVLETVVLGGNLGFASVSGFPAMTSLTTRGNITDVKLNGNDKLTNLTLDHSHVSGSDGSSLEISDNPVLASVKTDRLDFIKNLTVTGNATLSSIDFSSMKTLLKDFKLDKDGQITINITDNDLSGNFTPYVEAGITGTTSNDEEPEIIESSDLYSLKPLIDAIEAFAVANDGTLLDAYGEVSFTFSLDNADVVTDDSDDTKSITGSSDNEWYYTWSDTENVINGVPKPIE